MRWRGCGNAIIRSQRLDYWGKTSYGNFGVSRPAAAAFFAGIGCSPSRFRSSRAVYQRGRVSRGDSAVARGIAGPESGHRYGAFHAVQGSRFHSGRRDHSGGCALRIGAVRLHSDAGSPGEAGQAADRSDPAAGAAHERCDAEPGKERRRHLECGCTGRAAGCSEADAVELFPGCADLERAP